MQRNLEYELARSLLDQLSAADPYELAYQLQLAELDLAEGRAAEATERLSGLHRDFPGSHAIVMAYAEALIHGRDPGQSARAAEILKQQTLKRGDDPSLLALYARAASLAVQC